MTDPTRQADHAMAAARLLADRAAPSAVAVLEVPLHTGVGMSSLTVVYTDGACSPNPGPGGWAWAVPEGPYASGAAARTTNQRMEIMAVLEAVRALDGPLEVVSDSSYVVRCFRDRWWEGWLERGWVNARRRPVVNRDLWEPLVAAARERTIAWRWVKGRSGDPMNELVDRLAVQAARTQQPRGGKHPAWIPPARPQG